MKEIMEVLCPSCGYHLVSVDASTRISALVKAEQLSPFVPDEASLSTSSVTKPRPVLDKSIEAGSAQQSGCDTLTTVDKIQIQELHKAGYALARIRQLVGKNVTLAQIEAAAKLDKGRK
jgi:hypothetical protein